MKSLRLPLLFILLSSCWVLAQSQSAQYLRMFTFSNTFYEGGQDVTIMPNNDLVLVGNTSKCVGSTCNHAGAMVRTSPHGDVRWATKMGNSGKNMTAMATCIGNDGNLMMASHYGSNSILSKLDTSGQVIWHQMVQASGNFWPRSVIGAHHAYFVVGEINDGSVSPSIRAAFICRIEENGTFGWIKFFEIPGSLSQFHRILLNSAGELVVTGAGPRLQDRRLPVIFFDQHGNIIRSWGFLDINQDSYPLIEDMIITADGGYLFSARGNNNGSFCLVKIAADGTVEWGKRYRSAPTPDQIVCVVEDHFGGYLVMGSRAFFSNASYFMTMKIDPAGNFLWGMDTDNPDEDRIYRVLQAENCGYVIAGMSDGIGVPAWMLAKADSSGKTGAETSAFTAPWIFNMNLQKDSLQLLEINHPTTIQPASVIALQPAIVKDQTLNFTPTPSCKSATSLSSPASFSWKIGPNPMEDWIQIDWEGEFRKGIFSLFDLQGRQLKSWEISEKSQMYVGELPAGVYVLKRVDEGQRSGKLLIKR